MTPAHNLHSLSVEVELGVQRDYPMVRDATLKIGGVRIFSEPVYDANPDGSRDEKRAIENLLITFAYRLNREALRDEF